MEMLFLAMPALLSVYCVTGMILIVFLIAGMLLRRFSAHEGEEPCI